MHTHYTQGIASSIAYLFFLRRFPRKDALVYKQMDIKKCPPAQALLILIS
jgi:hypothetical protein